MDFFWTRKWSDSKLVTGAVEGWDSVLVFLDPSRHGIPVGMIHESLPK